MLARTTRTLFSSNARDDVWKRLGKGAVTREYKKPRGETTMQSVSLRLLQATLETGVARMPDIQTASVHKGPGTRGGLGLR